MVGSIGGMGFVHYTECSRVRYWRIHYWLYVLSSDVQTCVCCAVVSYIVAILIIVDSVAASTVVGLTPGIRVVGTLPTRVTETAHHFSTIRATSGRGWGRGKHISRTLSLCVFTIYINKLMGISLTLSPSPTPTNTHKTQSCSCYATCEPLHVMDTFRLGGLNNYYTLCLKVGFVYSNHKGYGKSTNFFWVHKRTFCIYRSLAKIRPLQINAHLPLLLRFPCRRALYL